MAGIAPQDGHQDSGLFSRRWKRKGAPSPARYRRHFSTLEEQLRRVARR